MLKLKHLAFLLIALIAVACNDKSTESKFQYETIEGDPLGAKIYTLKNGLKVFLSVNPDEPRVVTQIAVRTGSKQDPADATGLAHYLEHMLFKGTSNYGTKNWEEEKVLLQQISDLYEAHRNTTDSTERKKIYLAIDSISGEAAKLAISNEYDKMISSLGAQGTNAYTWYEQTVYINDVPSNELEKWMQIESERFSELVLRLFHTELEAVYEEFNRTQDSDQRLAYYTMMENLFKNHQYGTQTTIGTSDHLKNPSMEKIHAYFKERYLPNNMAIILSGDIDPDQCVEMVEKYFGHYEAGTVPSFEVVAEEPIATPIVADVEGVQPEFVTIGFRLPGSNSNEALMLQVMDAILSNGKAGLIDLNLVQKQKVLRASSSPMIFTDYSVFSLDGNPREGQDLQEVADLLLEQLNKIKSGDFDEWMVEAVVRDMKVRQLRQNESNWARAGKMTDSFVYHRPWADVVKEIDVMSTFTKADIVSFANTWFGDNYVQVNKRYGTNKAVKVEKPQITPVDIDRESQSPFYVSWDSIKSGRVKPLFLDYEKDIQSTKLDNGLDLSSIKNKNNDLFSLYYILDMGTDHDKELALAVEYLPYLGTSKFSAEDLQKEFFKLGLSFNVNTSRDQVYVQLRGLGETLEAGVALFEEILADVQPDAQAYNDMVDGILKKRQDDMKNKNRIMFAAMASYAQYGPESPYRNMLSEDQLKAIQPEQLTEKIKGLTGYQHRIFYYGADDLSDIKTKLDKLHKVPETLKTYPEPLQFTELPIDKNKVYFVDYDMVQSEIMLLGKGSQFSEALLPTSNMFNQYFGGGLSSIVFQEIRESKALAYSAYSQFTTPTKAGDSHYVRAYIGAQVDKLPEATNAMLELMNDIPRADIQFEAARDAAMKQIETNRTTRESIFWSYERAKKLGLKHDMNKPVYDALQTMSFDDLQKFFDENIKGKNYTFCVIGNKKMVDHNVLKELGEYEELTLEDLFGYARKGGEPTILTKN
jgi:predicted Zn-dependent peptidase